MTEAQPQTLSQQVSQFVATRVLGDIPNAVRERAKLVIQPDWDAINAQRDTWTKRWNREVER